MLSPSTAKFTAAPDGSVPGSPAGRAACKNIDPLFSPHARPCEQRTERIRAFGTSRRRRSARRSSAFTGAGYVALTPDGRKKVAGEGRKNIKRDHPPLRQMLPLDKPSEFSKFLNDLESLLFFLGNRASKLPASAPFTIAALRIGTGFRDSSKKSRFNFSIRRHGTSAYPDSAQEWTPFVLAATRRTMFLKCPTGENFTERPKQDERQGKVAGSVEQIHGNSGNPPCNRRTHAADREIGK